MPLSPTLFSMTPSNTPLSYTIPCPPSLSLTLPQKKLGAATNPTSYNSIYLAAKLMSTFPRTSTRNSQCTRTPASSSGLC